MQGYRACNLSSKIAHSIIVTPILKASSFTSLSLVSSVSFATARKCPSVTIPSLARAGEMCSSEGSHDASTLSKATTDEDLMLLMVEPDSVGWNGSGSGSGSGGSSRSRGATALYGVDTRGGVGICWGGDSGSRRTGVDDRGGVPSSPSSDRSGDL